MLKKHLILLRQVVVCPAVYESLQCDALVVASRGGAVKLGWNCVGRELGFATRPKLIHVVHISLVNLPADEVGVGAGARCHAAAEDARLHQTGRVLQPGTCVV